MPVDDLLSQIGLTREIVHDSIQGKSVVILAVRCLTQGQLLAIAQAIEDAAHKIRKSGQSVCVSMHLVDMLIRLGVGYQHAGSTLWRKVVNLRLARRNARRGRRGQDPCTPPFDDELFVGSRNASPAPASVPFLPPPPPPPPLPPPATGIARIYQLLGIPFPGHISSRFLSHPDELGHTRKNDMARLVFPLMEHILRAVHPDWKAVARVVLKDFNVEAPPSGQYELLFRTL